MIDYNEIAKVCSELDAMSDQGATVDSICAHRGVNPRGLLDAATQRATRIALMVQGQDPRRLPRDRTSHVHIEPSIRADLKWLEVAFIDGFLAGRAITDPSDRVQRFPER